MWVLKTHSFKQKSFSLLQWFYSHISFAGCFTPEPFQDFSMALLALVIFATHMFVVLQIVGMVSIM